MATLPETDDLLAEIERNFPFSSVVEEEKFHEAARKVTDYVRRRCVSMGGLWDEECFDMDRMNVMFLAANDPAHHYDGLSFVLEQAISRCKRCLTTPL